MSRRNISETIFYNFRRGKLHGIVVYTPVPEVSMFDLTVHVNCEQADLYQQVCDAVEREARGPLKHVLSYRQRVGDETRYDWRLFISILYYNIPARVESSLALHTPSYLTSGPGVR